MNDALDRSLPSPDSVSPVPESVSSDGDASAEAAPEEGRSEEGPDRTRADEGPDLSSLPESYRDPVRRLYRRVQEATETIERLRAENERLRARVRKLKDRPVLPDDKTVLALDDESEQLRARIDHFIDAIDAYLEATAPDESDDDSSSPAD